MVQVAKFSRWLWHPKSCVFAVLVVMWIKLSPATGQEPEIRPPENATVFLNDPVVFRCTVVGDLYWWEINGIRLRDLPAEMRHEIHSEAIPESGSFRLKLTFSAATSMYNGTRVHCLTRLLSGPWRSSPVAMLWIQGTLPPVSDISATSNSSSIKISWTAPFSLNVTGVDNDIWYSVIIYNDENNSTVINCTDCINITDTYYTFSPNSSGVFNFSIIPFNGAGEGEKSHYVTEYSSNGETIVNASATGGKSVVTQTSIIESFDSMSSSSAGTVPYSTVAIIVAAIIIFLLVSATSLVYPIVIQKKKSSTTKSCFNGEVEKCHEQGIHGSITPYQSPETPSVNQNKTDTIEHAQRNLTTKLELTKVDGSPEKTDTEDTDGAPLPVHSKGIQNHPKNVESVGVFRSAKEEQGGEATTEQPDQYGYYATLKEEKENSSSPAVVESNVEHPTGGLIRGAKIPEESIVDQMAEVLIFATQTIVKDPTLNDDVLLEEGGEIETQVAFFMETEKGKRVSRMVCGTWLPYSSKNVVLEGSEGSKGHSIVVTGKELCAVSKLNYAMPCFLKPTLVVPDHHYVGINHNTLPLMTNVEKEAGKTDDVERGACKEDGSSPECTESAGKGAEKSRPVIEGMLNLTVPDNPTQHTPNKPSLPPERPGVKKPPTFNNADTVTNVGTVQTNPERLNSPTIAEGKKTKERLIKSFILACVWGYFALEQHHPTILFKKNRVNSAMGTSEQQ